MNFSSDSRGQIVLGAIIGMLVGLYAKYFKRDGSDSDESDTTATRSSD